MLGAATFFCFGAAIECASIFMRQNDKDTADSMLLGGALITAVGLPVLVYSIALDPLKGYKR
jgi:hypothetical protein